MFYLISSRLFFSKANIDKFNMFKIFVIGTILYIILHTLLYSSRFDNNEIIKKYRVYLYYIWATDAILIGLDRLFIMAAKKEITNNVLDVVTDSTSGEIFSKKESIKKENELINSPHANSKNNCIGDSCPIQKNKPEIINDAIINNQKQNNNIIEEPIIEFEDEQISNTSIPEYKE
jgi:hypothetical protein